MRLSALMMRLCVFFLAAFVAVLAARAGVGIVENRSVIEVQERLIDNDHNWASVLADGLQVILEGEAPSEAARFRAISTAGAVVDASRVIDNMSVVEAKGITPPEFAIEILRNDSGITLIGLVPATTDREQLVDRIRRLSNNQPVTDLLEIADYPAPDTWKGAVDYAIRALGQLPRSKISITSHRVSVDAISDSLDEKRTFETTLARSTPEGVNLAINITAPRPVISPFTTRFTLDGEGARFAACAVDTADAERAIISAASEYGFEGKSTCIRALGAPSTTWGDAVSMSIKAVGDLGGGTVTVANTDIAITALQGTSEDLFADVIGRLQNTLPDVFAVKADLPPMPNDEVEGPPQFTATRSPEGQVQLRGTVPDELTNKTVENFAKAKFGATNIVMRTRVGEELPSGWSVRMLAGLDVLSELSNGSVLIEPEKVVVRGNTGSEGASAKIAALLVDKLGEAADFEVDVTYVKQLDPIASLPTPQECIEQITIVTEARKILFDPSSASITADTQPVVDDIAEILQKCPNLQIQIAGYTDSQGREVMNQRLSQERAQAVLDALRLRRVPVSSFNAIGFGEADPIATNDTADGREANRRIEFTLIAPETTAEEPTTLEQIEADAPATDN